MQLTTAGHCSVNELFTWSAVGAFDYCSFSIMIRQKEDVKITEFNPSTWRLRLVLTQHAKMKYKHTSSDRHISSRSFFFLGELYRLEIVREKRRRRRRIVPIKSPWECMNYFPVYSCTSFTYAITYRQDNNKWIFFIFYDLRLHNTWVLFPVTFFFFTYTLSSIPLMADRVIWETRSE